MGYKWDEHSLGEHPSINLIRVQEGMNSRYSLILWGIEKTAKNSWAIAKSFRTGYVKSLRNVMNI